MALFDDHRFLLSHIHHSFITCDDTGMCEMAMLNEVVTDKTPSFSCEEKVLNYYSDAMESEFLEAGQSYDVASGIGFMGGHRHRSNTAQRLERLRKEKQMQAKIAHIQWKECPDRLTGRLRPPKTPQLGSPLNPQRSIPTHHWGCVCVCVWGGAYQSLAPGAFNPRNGPAQKDFLFYYIEKELSELFPKKNLSDVKEKKANKKSSLAEALELFPAVANNPFNEYARFDGRINRSAASKKILIYLMMLPPDERSYGMEVVCLSSARVQELIGLICWMYTCEGKEPKLQPPVSNYCLKIAEETGEVDEDFPNLEGNEFVGKFGFPCLALIKNKKKTSQVTVHIKDEVAKVDVPSLAVTLREVAYLASCKISVQESKAYHMEKLQEPGIPIPLDSKLLNYNNFDFCLVFEESNQDPMQKEFGTEEYDSHMRAVEAPLYRSFNVSYCQKMGMNYDVQLGISGEKVEINPLPPKGAAKLLSRPQKPTTYYMDSIAACEIISKKYSPGKCIFKLVHYTGSEFKKSIFESDPQTAQDVVKKVQIILEMHSSQACKEYQIHRRKKLEKKAQKSHLKMN